MTVKLSSKKQEILTGYIFLAPFLIGLTIFVIIPIFYTVFLSFVDYNSLGTIGNFKFVGLQNYKEVLQDKGMIASYFKSIKYSLVYVPCMIILSLLMASIMNKKFYFRTATRTMIFMPYVANVTAVAIVFNVLLNPYDGPINAMLKFLGVKNPPGWLMDTNMALPVTAMIATWANLAFQTIVFLAALQEVPEELYEATEIDGASAWQKFTKITLPWISPTTFFLVVTTIIGSTQNFSGIYTLTQGGPGDSTEVAIISIYHSGFQFNKYSIASAQSMILFAALLVITIIQWRGQKKWVNY